MITPHSIATDAEDHVYVAGRGNRRIQVFDTHGGTPLRQIAIDVPYDPDVKPAIGNRATLPVPAGTPRTMAPGSPWTICITPGPHQVLYGTPIRGVSTK